jgi:hypothetical protein
MKKLIVLVAFAFIITHCFGQSSATEKMYEQLKGSSGVSLLTFSKDMIDMIDLSIDDDTDEKKVTGPLREIRVAICKDSLDRSTIPLINGFLNKSPFKEVDLEDEKGDLRIFVNRKGRAIEECHVAIPGDNGLILVSFFGEFRVEDVDNLREAASGFE